MSLGKRIKKLRNIHKMTQKELGEKLNIAKSTVSQYENDINTPDIHTLLKISEIFDVSLDYLVRNEKQEKNSENKLHNSVSEIDELNKYRDHISHNKELQKLIEETKNLNPKTIKKIIKISKILDD